MMRRVLAKGIPDTDDLPLHWKRPRRILVPSMGDLFLEEIPFEFVHRVFTVTQKAYQHTYLVLTKRPDRLLPFINECAMHVDGSLDRLRKGTRYHSCYAWPHGNVWLGISVENQEWFDKRLPYLLEIPAQQHRWVSFEPLLGPIVLPPAFGPPIIEYAVIGCETGPNHRPCNLHWIIDLVCRLRERGIRCFLKQIRWNSEITHEPNEWPAEVRARELI
jgi:protein gp37